MLIFKKKYKNFSLLAFFVLIIGCYSAGSYAVVTQTTLPGRVIYTFANTNPQEVIETCRQIGVNPPQASIIQLEIPCDVLSAILHTTDALHVFNANLLPLVGRNRIALIINFMDGQLDLTVQATIAEALQHFTGYPNLSVYISHLKIDPEVLRAICHTETRGFSGTGIVNANRMLTTFYLNEHNADFRNRSGTPNFLPSAFPHHFINEDRQSMGFDFSNQEPTCIIETLGHILGHMNEQLPYNTYLVRLIIPYTMLNDPQHGRHILGLIENILGSTGAHIVVSLIVGYNNQQVDDIYMGFISNLLITLGARYHNLIIDLADVRIGRHGQGFVLSVNDCPGTGTITFRRILTNHFCNVNNQGVLNWGGMYSRVPFMPQPLADMPQAVRPSAAPSAAPPSYVAAPDFLVAPLQFHTVPGLHANQPHADVVQIVAPDTNVPQPPSPPTQPKDTTALPTQIAAAAAAPPDEPENATTVTPQRGLWGTVVNYTSWGFRSLGGLWGSGNPAPQ